MDDCPSCRHLRAAIDAIWYLNDLVPLPDHAQETLYYLVRLNAGHLNTSHNPWGRLSTSASDDMGVTAVRETVMENPPDGLNRVD